ncbi:MAG: hypothetical protein EPN93_20455 [Spirochaetes bacterium]|nr:MAG: hypothetical protein EPN93_20455 [Spirochaetota bacterium]
MKSETVKSTKKESKKTISRSSGIGKTGVISSKYSNEEKLVLNKIKNISTKARKQARKNNATVTIIRDGRIVAIAPDKKEQVLGRVIKSRINIDFGKPIKIK